MYRISRMDHGDVIDVERVEQIEPTIQSSEPGPYHVFQICTTSLPYRQIARRWGIGIKRPDGSVVLERCWRVPWLRVVHD
jgi:hypothetical protein